VEPATVIWVAVEFPPREHPASAPRKSSASAPPISAERRRARRPGPGVSAGVLILPGLMGSIRPRDTATSEPR